MTKMLRVQISNAHKKSFVEVCKWSCKLEDIVENLDTDDEDHQLLKENLKLEADDKWLEMTEEVGWRWGSGSVVMTKEDYDAYDFDNEENLEKRIDNILNQIETLNELSLNDIKNLCKKVEPKIEHNYQNIKKQKPIFTGPRERVVILKTRR